MLSGSCNLRAVAAAAAVLCGLARTTSAAPVPVPAAGDKLLPFDGEINYHDSCGCVGNYFIPPTTL